MRTDILERKEEILQWIEENQSKAFICKQLQCKQDTLNAYLEKWVLFILDIKIGQRVKN